MILANKIAGRLAALDLVSTNNKDVANVKLTEAYGRKLASLISDGNIDAINLVKTMEECRYYKDEPDSDPEQIRALEGSIQELGKKLGIIMVEANLDLADIMQLATSANSFSSQKHFRNHLTEGLVLNVTKIASDVLSIPSGHYVIWATDANHTMLVPTGLANENKVDISSSRPGSFDITTKDLLGCWNKVERVIGEEIIENKARVGRPALKKKVNAVGGVRAAAKLTGLSPGNVSKHVNDSSYEISGASARAYINKIGASPNDLYKLGKVQVQ